MTQKHNAPANQSTQGAEAAYTWVGLAKDDKKGPPWNYYVLDADGKEIALCQMPDGADHAEQIVDALNHENAAFDLRWKADMRAIKRWQEANPGNDLVWPDHADLVVWLLEQLDAAKAIEARSGETERLDGDSHESAVAESDLPKDGNPQDRQTEGAEQ